MDRAKKSDLINHGYANCNQTVLNHINLSLLRILYIYTLGLKFLSSCRLA
jgi:hypothetical protein